MYILLTYPIIRLLFFLIGGIALAILNPCFLSINACEGLILICIISLLISVRIRIRTEKMVFISGCLACMLTFWGGVCLTILDDPRSKSDFFASQKFNALIGTCDEDISDYPGMIRFKLNVEGVSTSLKINQIKNSVQTPFIGSVNQFPGLIERSSGKVIIYIKKPCPAVNYGDKLILYGSLSPIQQAASPHGFNQKKYLEYHQVYQNYFCKASGVSILPEKRNFSVRAVALHVQKACSRILNLSMADSASSSFLSALLLGSRGNIDPDLYQAFSKTGTVHIISVSGLHVQIVYAVFAMILPFGKLRNNWKKLIFIRRLILTLFIWFYALISGFSPAVLRSAVMISFFILAEGMPRRIPSRLVYFSSATCILLVDPWALADMGFQLSYLAVGSLMAFQSKIYGIILFKNHILNSIWNMCSTSIAAQVLTFPLCLFYFHQYPTYFILANLLIIPITYVMLYGGILQLAICYIGSLLSIAINNWWICRLMEKLYHLMSWLLLKTASLPYASLNGYYPSCATVMLLYLLIILLTALYNKPHYVGFCISLAILTCLLTQNLLNQFDHLENNQVLNIKLKGKTITLILNGRYGVICSDTLDKVKYQRYLLPEFQAYGIHRIRYYKTVKHQF